MPAAGPPLNPDAIRAIRDARGMTMEDLAAKLGVSGAHLSNVEAGKRGLGQDKVRRLADALRVPIVAILGCAECARRNAA